MSTPLPTTLRLLSAIRDVPRAAWDALLDDAARPFLEWTFLSALEESGSASPATGWRPRHLTLWRGGRLVAAAPAYLKDDSGGEFVFDGGWATVCERMGLRYFPKLVLAVPFTPATGRRVLVASGEDRLAREAELYAGALEYARAEGLSGVHVLFPTAEEAGRLEAAGWLLRLGVQYHWHNAGYARFEDFVARFHARRRSQVRRELRAPAAQGLTLTTLRGEALAQVDPAQLHAIYLSTVERQARGGSRRRYDLTPGFFTRLLADFRDRVELVEARGRDGRLVASAFNLVGEGVLHGRYWGAFESHPFLHFNVCLYHPVADAIARGHQRFEAGAGGEHKLVRGFEPSLTYSAHFVCHAALEPIVRSFLVHERAAVRQGLPQWRRETGLRHQA